MALVVADRVQETSSTSGTGTLTLAGAVAGYTTFSATIGNGNTTFYTIYDSTTYDWEVGIGTVGAGTLARTTVLSNSLGTTAKISFAANTKSVFCTYPSERSLYYDASNVATIGEVLGYSDTGIIGSFASTTAGYNQVIIQNKSSATNASANINVSNDASTASSGYAELGINSSTFTGTGSFNIASGAYLASAGTDLTMGTYTAHNLHFVTNSSTTDAMTIFNSGGVSLGGQPDPGLGTLYANNVFLGFTTITAAAGTTILTSSSSGWQQVVGTTTQTIQLPNATTLYKGLAYTIANNSTGSVTIKDSASTTLDTTVTGGTSILVLTANGTSAGTWVAYSYVPSTYDFSTTTANFGNATLTNGLWNGTTISSDYGGTGLTTFSAANNALYSTSASALAAGTLPIAAGGTAKTTFTSNGVVYGNGTSALGVTSAGTTGQVLVGNTGSAPSWGAIPTTAAVTSFQTSLSGLTPSSATTGAVTLAGTLGPTSGGTGLASYTTGDIIYASATNTLSALADVATGNALISGGVTTAPSWGKIGLTTHVSGTLPVANGGTGQSSNLTQYGVVYGSTTTAMASTAAGTSAQVLHGNATGAPTWGAVALGSEVSGTLPVANGGTGQTTYTDGQLLIGNSTGNTLTKATLTGTASQVTVTNGSGSVTLSLPSSINVNTTGSAATLTTARAIYGNNFDGSAALTQVIASTYGGTGNGFTKFTGPTTAEKTFTLPDATATILTSNAAVTVAQGGTGVTSATAYALLAGGTTSTGAFQSLASVGTSGQVLTSNGAGALPTFQTAASGGVTSISFGTTGLTPSTTTTGAVTVAGTLAVANGGTGVTSSTGTGANVLGTAPTFTTSIDSGATFGAFASSTALTIGYTGTGAASTTNISTAALTGAFTKTVNLGTGGTTGSTTAINIGSATTSTTTIRGALLVGAASASTVDGAIFATNNITAYATSDKKFKENIRDIPNALEKVDMIGGKLFDWSTEYIEKMGGQDDYFMRREDAGVIAQDVEKAMPELVRTRDDGSLAVDYPKLVALAFAAIKELKAEIDELKGK